MSGDRKRGDYVLQDWVDRWTQQQIGFHKGRPNEMLVKHLDKMLNDRSEIKILLPLCGKAMDIKWLYDQGHTVVGVECAEQALQEFFQENNVEYLVEKVDKIEGKLYKSLDGRVRLYCCDFFKFTDDVETDFQGVYDRGALVAINETDRERYAVLMTSLLGSDCCYLLQAYDYDPLKYQGPPHYLSEMDIHKLFEAKCRIKQLDVRDALSENLRNEWGLDKFDEKVFLIQPK